MNSIQRLFILMCILSVPFFTACDKDDDEPQTCDYTTELQAELNAVVAAAEAYGQNPTTANCNAYKNSLQVYLNEAEDFRTCAVNAGQGAQFQASIDQYQAIIDAIQC